MAKQKLKLPKRLAGIKVPKPLRRSSKRFAKHLRKTGGLEFLAHALVAAGTALMSSPKARQAMAEVGQNVKDSGAALTGIIGDKAASGTQDLTSAAKELLPDKPEKKRKKDKKLRGEHYRIEEPAQRRH
jgi:hypothetical protein